MPFTFSHPAIVLPLTYLPKRWYSLTGIVIGSLTPNFEYFLRMKIKSIYSHTIEGVFWFDITLGVILAFIFHNLVRDELFDNLPIFLKSRFSSFKKFNWNIYFKQNWIIVLISILIGSCSHIFWDDFTHNSGYFVHKFSILSTNIHFGLVQIPTYKILQHLSTLIGGILISYAIYKLPKKEEKLSKKIDSKYWAIIALLTFSIFTIRIINGLNFKQFGSTIVTCISAIVISLTLTPLLLDKIKKK